MNDLISRQAAIDALDKRFDSIPMEQTVEVLQLRRDLRELPSAQPEDKCGECDAWNQYKNYPRQKWIPVGERLPDIGEHYVSEPCLCYCSNGAYCFGELQGNIFGQVGWNCERDDDYHEAVGEVIAWMPLPEPYKESE